MSISLAQSSSNTEAIKGIVDASAVSGIVSVIFALTGILLGASGKREGARWMLWLSATFAAIGAVGTVAGTQSWIVTTLSMLGVAAMLGIVLYFTREDKAVVDAEAGGSQDA